MSDEPQYYDVLEKIRVLEERVAKLEKKPRPTANIPGIAELRDYIEEKGYDVCAESWMDHYQSKGWKIGRGNTPMRDWKAAVRNANRDGWCRKNTDGSRVGDALRDHTCEICGNRASKEIARRYFCPDHRPGHRGDAIDVTAGARAVGEVLGKLPLGKAPNVDPEPF